MTRLPLLLPIALLLVPLLSAAGISGAWQVFTTAESGDEIEWKMVIVEQDGKLSGTLSSELGDFTLENLKFDSGVLTFKVIIDSEDFLVDARIHGSDVEGNYKSRSEKGTLKGKQQS
ncbi:MAG TPA: hypothetical protein VF767_01475 [Bryobacteraceae bacterium]